MSDDDDDDDVSSCGHRIGLSDKIGSFEPLSLEHAKRICGLSYPVDVSVLQELVRSVRALCLIVT